jgi:hypothetical protein
MYGMRQPRLSAYGDAVPINFQFDSWTCPVAAVAKLALDRLVVADEVTQRQFVAFTGTSVFRLLGRWFSLTVGSPIPLTYGNVAWDEASPGPSLAVRITPGWPTDFSVTLRCLDELGAARLRGHLEFLLH